MGVSGSQKKYVQIYEDLDIIEKNNTCIFFDAYKSIKQMIILLNSFKNISINAYIIKTNTIPNFINIIKSLKILSYIITKNDVIDKLEKDLNKKLDKYELEEDIKILYEYDGCINMIKSNEEKDNEFIIVDELFCRTMKIKDYYYEYKKVNINIESKKFIFEIYFYSGNKINFRKTGMGFYKFIEDKEII